MSRWHVGLAGPTKLGMNRRAGRNTSEVRVTFWDDPAVDHSLDLSHPLHLVRLELLIGERRVLGLIQSLPTYWTFLPMFITSNLSPKFWYWTLVSVNKEHEPHKSSFKLKYSNVSFDLRQCQLMF